MTNLPVSERIGFVGGSEVAALLGVLPYKTRFELWHEKKANIEQDDLDNVERIQAGQFMEAAIADWAQAKWPDMKLRNVHRYIKHPTVGRFGASLDRETVEGHWPVEIKNVDATIFYRDEEWQNEDGLITDAPSHILVQVQSQLACSGKSTAWLVVCVGGNRLYRMKVERHDKIISRLEGEVTEFWRSFDADEEPKPDFTRDGEVIRSLYPDTLGETIDLSGDNYAATLADTLLLARERRNDWDRAADVASAELLDKIKEAGIAKLNDGRFIEAPVRRRKGFTVEPSTFRMLKIKGEKENSHEI